MVIGEVIEERKIRYIFKEYVKDKKDLIVELFLNLFIDFIIVMKKGK